MRIAKAATECEVDTEGDEVGKCFEEDMRMDAVRAEADVDGEGNGEMERELDTAL